MTGSATKQRDRVSDDYRVVHRTCGQSHRPLTPCPGTAGGIDGQDPAGTDPAAEQEER